MSQECATLKCSIQGGYYLFSGHWTSADRDLEMTLLRTGNMLTHAIQKLSQTEWLLRLQKKTVFFHFILIFVGYLSYPS